MSYSYYLIHGLPLKGFLSAFAMAYPSRHRRGGVLLAAAACRVWATLVPSAVLFIAVEKPFSLTMRRKSTLRGPEISHSRSSNLPITPGGQLLTKTKPWPIRRPAIYCVTQMKSLLVISAIVPATLVVGVVVS